MFNDDRARLTVRRWVVTSYFRPVNVPGRPETLGLHMGSRGDETGDRSPPTPPRIVRSTPETKVEERGYRDEPGLYGLILPVDQ